MDKKKFALRFKESLSKQNMSAAELSRKTGISEGVISQYKSGKYEPKRDRLELFANILEVKPGWLSGYDNEDDDSEAFSPQEDFDIKETAFRLGFLRENNNLSIKDVAETLNISENLVKRREMGDSVGEITAKEISIMSNLFNTSISYIMNWGVDDPSLNADKLLTNHSVHGLPDFSLLAVVERVSVGVNRFEYHNFAGYISENIYDLQDCFFFKQNDNSMECEIRSDDCVLIQKSEFIENGKVGLVCVNGGNAIVRKFIHRENDIILQPFNIAEFDPIIIPWEETDCLKIVGQALYSLSRKNWSKYYPAEEK